LHLVGCLYYCIKDARSNKHQIVAALLEVAGSHTSVATIESYETLNGRQKLDP